VKGEKVAQVQNENSLENSYLLFRKFSRFFLNFFKWEDIRGEGEN
jgi:hypothetical protein